MQKALIHLKKDKILKKLIEQIGPIPTKASTDLYLYLLKTIVSQQLSVRAADTIWQRFLLLFKNGYPEAKTLLKLKNETLRAAGLSNQKAGYLKNIAQFSINFTLDYENLESKPDQELIEYLTQIKGVGKWTVDMLMMFALNRPNVLPLNDLGIQNGIKALYLIESTNKKELYLKMNLVAKKWEPYRTLACKYLWRYKDLEL